MAIRWDSNSHEVTLFRNYLGDGVFRSADAKVWQAARATSAAPTYFGPWEHTGASKAQYVDGGLTCNNPSLAGLLEAKLLFGKQLQDLSVLSIGTGTVPLHVQSQSLNPSLFSFKGLARRMVEVGMASTSFLTKDMMPHLLPPQNYLRVNGRVLAGDMADAKLIPSWQEEAEHLVSRTNPTSEALKKFCELLVARSEVNEGKAIESTAELVQTASSTS